MRITTLADIRSYLNKNDLTYITWLSAHRRLNQGKGYSYEYVRRVLDEKDKRWNEDIIRLALAVIASRGLIEQGDKALEEEVERMWAAIHKPEKIT